MSSGKTNKLHDPKYRERVYKIVRRIPRGLVMTYGQIAILLGEGYTARTVGFVMHSCPDDVPWQRVINSQGMCSTQRLVLPHNLQQQMLAQEGVEFSDKGKCDVEKYRWFPTQRPEQKKERTKLFG
jgi:methylated-DNA-protein-cysteine methyltransferase-like protein